jgi:hypothetical protein
VAVSLEVEVGVEVGVEVEVVPGAGVWGHSRAGCAQVNISSRVRKVRLTLKRWA